jgi:putative methyltransferase
MRKRVCIVNFQQLYRESPAVQLPYVYGALRSHAELSDELRCAYAFEAPVCLTDESAALMAQAVAPDVVGFSVYVWNHERSHRLARAIKEKSPRSLIVFGGPHVPNDPSDYLERHPWVDLCVHGEGEMPFSGILSEFLREAPRWDDVGGISFRRDGGQHFTRPGGRMASLDLPSPFIAGFFDEFITRQRARGLDVSACLETNRGCPYSCAFCDWGMAINTKLRQYPMSRVLAELEWIATQRIPMLYLNDANFGLLPRDLDIMRHIIDLKRRTGYPQQLVVLGFAKNNKDRAFEINRLIQQNGLDHVGNVNFSLQATNQETLDAIFRQNIPLDNYRVLAERYQAEKYELVPDLIFPLPGETLASFKAGYADLASWPHVKFLRVYPCSILPNAPMAKPAYREKWGLRTRMSRLVPPGLTPLEPHEEMIETVVATRLIDAADVAEARVFIVVVDAFEVYGLLRALRRLVTALHGVTPLQFYERLIDWWRANPGTITEVLRAIYRDALEHSEYCEELGWSGMVSVWPLTLRPQKALTYVALTQSLQFEAELGRFLQLGLGLPSSRVERDLLRFQTDQWLKPDYEAREYRFSYAYDWVGSWRDGTLRSGPLQVSYAPRDELVAAAYQPSLSSWLEHLLRPTVPQTRCVQASQPAPEPPGVQPA